MKMGVENGMFRSEIGSGFEDPGGTPPPRIPGGYSSGFLVGITWFAGTIELWMHIHGERQE